MTAQLNHFKVVFCNLQQMWFYWKSDVCVLFQMIWMGRPCTCCSLWIRSCLWPLKNASTICPTITLWCSVACMSTTLARDRKHCVSLRAHLRWAYTCIVPVWYGACFYSCVAAYAFAELIDNALSATANNTGKRIIEIRLVSVLCLDLYQYPLLHALEHICPTSWFSRTECKIKYL